jgi:hypothetical protein
VTEDIISKIDDVLLYPLDEHSISKILIQTTDLKSGYWLREGYFFKTEGKNMSFGKLSDSLTEADLKKLTLPATDLQEVEVQIDKAVLTFSSGKRYILDLISGTLNTMSGDKSLVYAGDKWVYYKNNLLAVFDINLKSVQFAKIFKNEEIAGVKYFDLNGKNYLLVRMNGQAGGTLYQYINQNLAEIVGEVVETPLYDETGNIIVLNVSGELWQYDSLSEKSFLLARFSGPVDLSGFALNKKNTSGQFLWKEAGNWHIGDIGFSNVRVMFKKSQILDLQLEEGGKIYYLEKIQTEAPENAVQIRLMEMDLDI